MSTVKTRAPAPSRSTASMTLGFGVINIPVQVFSGTQPSGIKRSEYARDPDTDGHLKVGRAQVIKDSDPIQIVRQDAIIKMVDIGGTLVELSDDEIDQVVDIPRGALQVVGFVKQEQLTQGHYVTDALYQVRPAKQGTGRNKRTDPNSERAFALLLKGMRRKGVFAAVKFSLRGRPRFGALLPDGRMYSLLFDHEVREDRPLPDVEVTDKELTLIGTLIDAATEEAAPELVDDYSDSIYAYLERKAATGESVAIEQTSEPEAPGTDLIGLLEAAVQGGA